MLITIEQRHTIGTEYQNCNDCALARALRERLPGIDVVVGGMTVTIDGKVYEYDPNVWNPDSCRWLAKSRFHSITLDIEDFLYPLFVSVAQEAAERLADKRVNN